MPYSPRATFDNPYGPAVTFRTLDVLPPSAYYVGVDEQVTLEVYTNAPGATFQMVVRVLSAQGVISLESVAVPSSGASAQTLSTGIQGMEGYVLSACVVSQNALPGSAFARVRLVRAPYLPSGPTTALLIAGYVSDKQILAYPTVPPRPAVEGPGNLRTFELFPAAGAEWSLTTYSGARWQLLGGRFMFTTSPAAGNRLVTVVWTDGGGGQIGVFPASQTQTPATAYIYTLTAGFTGNDNAPYISIPVPSAVLLDNQSVLSSSTNGLQAGDQYSGVWVRIAEWLGF